MDPLTYWLGPLPSEGTVIWDRVIQDYAMARRSLDGTMCVLKWRGNRPDGLPSGGTTYSDENPAIPRSVADLRAILDGPDWTEPEPA